MTTTRTSLNYINAATIPTWALNFHVVMGHQSVAKVIARLPDRHTWPCICHHQNLGQCITCQQVQKNKTRFDSIWKTYEMAPSIKWASRENYRRSKLTGILIIIDQFAKYRKAVSWTHERNDAFNFSVSQLLWSWKLFTWHKTLKRLQSDDELHLNAEVFIEFSIAWLITKVTSTTCR